ncbi:hypothetical protein Pelo_4044 [Pelomyxa schiedti]|nr:hypothetical protein Pelo_4044 [Pelomyxa schiedti]
MHRTPAALWDSLERWPVLEPCEKLKLVMSWLELNNINTTTTPGSVDSAKITKGINSVLDLGVCDQDEWVCVMSQIVRELCSTNHSSAIQNPIMLDALKSLEELLTVKGPPHFTSPEDLYLAPRLVTQQPQHTNTHFTPKQPHIGSPVWSPGHSHTSTSSTPAHIPKSIQSTYSTFSQAKHPSTSTYSSQPLPEHHIPEHESEPIPSPSRPVDPRKSPPPDGWKTYQKQPQRVQQIAIDEVQQMSHQVLQQKMAKAELTEQRRIAREELKRRKTEVPQRRGRPPSNPLSPPEAASPMSPYDITQSPLYDSMQSPLTSPTNMLNASPMRGTQPVESTSAFSPEATTPHSIQGSPQQPAFSQYLGPQTQHATTNPHAGLLPTPPPQQMVLPFNPISAHFLQAQQHNLPSLQPIRRHRHHHPQNRQPPSSQHTAYANSPPPNIDAIFGTTKLLTEENRQLIQAFFSGHRETNGPPIRQIPVTCETVTTPDGTTVSEEMLLELNMTTGAWKKVQKQSLIPPSQNQNKT